MKSDSFSLPQNLFGYKTKKIIRLMELHGFKSKYRSPLRSAVLLSAVSITRSQLSTESI